MIALSRHSNISIIIFYTLSQQEAKQFKPIHPFLSYNHSKYSFIGSNQYDSHTISFSFISLQ